MILARSTRWWGRTIGVALLLGLVTAAAVAWIAAVAASVPMYPRTEAGAFVLWGRAWGTAAVRGRTYVDVWWDDLALDAKGQEPAAAVAAARRTYDELAASRPGFSIAEGLPSWGTFAGSGVLDASVSIGSETAYGWPLPCLWYRVVGVYKAPVATATGIHGGIVLSGKDSIDVRGHSYRALPLFPVWGGLAIDAAVFAVAWFVVLFSLPLARRARRMRRGSCLLCGYDLNAATGEVCPECGGPRAAVLARG